MSLLAFKTYLVGFLVAAAYDDLSYKRVATQFPKYTGSEADYGAHNAVDRKTLTCMRTDEIGKNARHKTMWWKVDLGGVYNIYSINILFKNYDGFEMRQRGRFAGFSLYVSNNDNIAGSTLCYKDGPQLPPLNFSTVCAEYGQKVIFHNERLNNAIYPTGYEVNNVFTELCEVKIQGCNKSGVYGSNCDTPCPTNCRNNTCHIQNGTCFSCKPGWTGMSCNTKCQAFWYGKSCNEQCSGHCKFNITCNHATGYCDKGCAAGWTESMCNTECNDGKHGYNCVNNCSGHCLDNTPCHKQTGLCDGGCNPGYTESDCRKKCSYGYYGTACRERCSKYCKNNETCDHVSGVCPNGCEDGYTENQCNKSCVEGYYGANCSLKCFPNCKTCQHRDGYCSSCKEGYYGTNCSLDCFPNCKSDTCKQTTDSLCTCDTGWMGENCTEECVQSYGDNCNKPCSENCFNQTCDRLNGICLYGCKDGKMCGPVDGKTPHYSSNAVSAIVGGTVGTSVFLIIGAVLAVFFLRFKRKAEKINKRDFIALKTTHRLLREHEPPHSADDTFQHDHTNDTFEYAQVLHEKTKRGPPTNKHISVRNIRAHIANMSSNESAGFKNEYHDIPRGEHHPCLEAKKPENKVKNRYTTIYPYDHSRVILKTSSLVEGDYINANYIEDARGKRIYIATQGPKSKTIADFWNMIWQDEVCNIVCLTNLKEGAKNKCAQYWPDVNDKLQGGTLTVRHLEEKTYAKYIIRRFKIHNNSTRTGRHVTMFHYTTWSDHGVADPLSLVVFHRHVIRATANSAGIYTVVHCSAGVGRTGTYIALDVLYREGERTGKINVPMYVRSMRKDRMNMIQGDEQYKLLYRALMEAFGGPSRCMTTEKFVGAYQEQTCYANCGDVVQNTSPSSEFEELLSLRKEYTQQDYISGRAQISANYTESVLPVEEYICHLSYIKGHNTYYNAVLLQSYLEKDCLISAQYPLQDNSEDFLRLIKDFDARVVVFLCPLKDIESTPAWFPTDNQSKLNGLFFNKNISTTKASNVTMTKLNIQQQGFSEIIITVIDCPTWKEGKGTVDKRVLLDLIKAVKTEKSDQEGRIIVLSSDGATRCGPFFVVYNVLEQISVDREVDIFTTTRQLQVRRPEFVSTLEEYQLCHDTVAEYLLNDCVYGNC